MVLFVSFPTLAVARCWWAAKSRYSERMRGFGILGVLLCATSAIAAPIGCRQSVQPRSPLAENPALERAPPIFEQTSPHATPAPKVPASEQVPPRVEQPSSRETSVPEQARPPVFLGEPDLYPGESRRPASAVDEYPFMFMGRLTQGAADCRESESFTFRNIKSLNAGLKMGLVDCQYHIETSATGTTWIARCNGPEALTVEESLMFLDQHPAEDGKGTCRDAIYTKSTFRKSDAPEIICSHRGFTARRRK